ncbi:exosortase C-terminal domain/associated protein EpsI [Magnetococcus sp. PR-3]|uniref:exosortase C-terminal domain/associated protein EpsI n=1 Tax=Magnetococcus sp. PR-3 TaxID=3120355 RepID=UPI002FCE2986
MYRILSHKRGPLNRVGRAGLPVLSLLLLLLLSWQELVQMALVWESWADYQHGVFIPLLTVALLWQQRQRLAQGAVGATWPGVPLVLLGVLGLVLGRLALSPALGQYGFVLVFAGITLAHVGWQSFVKLQGAFLLMLLMVPLPSPLHTYLSTQLELISSVLGVALLQGGGVNVLLQGNVIDLGHYQLQVVEACSGLRYLLPFISFSALLILLLPLRWPAGVAQLLAATLLAVVINALRLAFTGLMAEWKAYHWMEGLYHDAQGWVGYLLGFAVLTALALKLRVAVDPTPQLPGGTHPLTQGSSRSSWITITVMVAGLGLFFPMPTQLSVQRLEKPLSQFPTQQQGWQTLQNTPLDAPTLAQLALDDYLLRTYHHGPRQVVTLYMAYYGRQQGSKATHSPRYCIPGGGWQILSQTARRLALPQGVGLPVNQLVIEKGGQKELVLYWFMQQGQPLASELKVKWHLLLNSGLGQRSDGALVRVSAPIPYGHTAQQVQGQMQHFIETFYPQIQAALPQP